MRPQQMKRLKKPEVPSDRQVYEGAPLTIPARIETPPGAEAGTSDAEVQELREGFKQAKQRLAEAENAAKELTDQAAKLSDALHKVENEREARHKEDQQKLEGMASKVKELEQLLEDATQPALPELEEITIDKIEKSKVADGKIMLLCELTLSPEAYGKAKAILAMDKAQVEKLTKLGAKNGK